MTAVRVGPVQLIELRQRLCARDLAILAQVADLRLMCTKQLQKVHFPDDLHASPSSAARCCRQALEFLVRKRLLVRLNRRIGGVRAGSSGFVYTLGPAGQRLLNLSGPRRRLREPSSLHVAHTLAISDLVVDLTVAARQRRFELITLEPEPACWRPIPGYARVVVRPDLFVAVGIGEYESRWFIEIDRETAHLPALLRKCRLYETYYRSGTEQAANGVFPRVLWVMPTERRAERLRTAVEAAQDLTAGLFLIASDPLPALEGRS